MRAAAAAALSALVPGAGQLLAGRPWRAVGYLAFSAVSMAAVVALLAAGRTRVLMLLVQPRWLTVALIAIVVSTLVRLAAAFDAYRLVRPVTSAPWPAAVVGVAVMSMLAAVVVVPHGMAGRYTWAQRDLVTKVFQAAAPQPVAPDPPVTHAPTTLPTPPSTPSPSSEPSSPEPDAWGNDGRYTVLLLGSDGGPGRHSARTDTMVLLSIAPHDGSAVMIGIPRNLVRIPFVQGPMRDRFPQGFTDIANAVYTYGVARPELFPDAVDSGATATQQAIAAVTGLEIDSWVMVDLAGLVGVVRALGGLTLNVPTPINDRVSPYKPGGAWVSASIPAGRQHLTPDEVYVYVRSRHADSDYFRMRRQRCVLETIGQTLTGPKLLKAYPDLAGSLTKSVTTDIPQAWLPDLVQLGSRLELARVSTLMLTPPLVDPKSPDYQQIRQLVEDAIAGALPEGDAASITKACG